MYKLTSVDSDANDQEEHDNVHLLSPHQQQHVLVSATVSNHEDVIVHDAVIGHSAGRDTPPTAEHSPFPPLQLYAFGQSPDGEELRQANELDHQPQQHDMGGAGSPLRYLDLRVATTAVDNSGETACTDDDRARLDAGIDNTRDLVEMRAVRDTNNAYTVSGLYPHIATIRNNINNCHQQEVDDQQQTSQDHQYNNTSHLDTDSLVLSDSMKVEQSEHHPQYLQSLSAPGAYLVRENSSSGESCRENLSPDFATSGGNGATSEDRLTSFTHLTSVTGARSDPYTMEGGLHHTTHYDSGLSRLVILLSIIYIIFKRALHFNIFKSVKQINGIKQ